MTRIIKINLTAKQRAKRQAAQAYGKTVMAPVLAELTHRDTEFAIEVSRFLARFFTQVIADRGDVGRAMGVIAGSAAELQPAFRPGAKLARAKADALFGGPAE